MPFKWHLLRWSEVESTVDFLFLALTFNQYTNEFDVNFIEFMVFEKSRGEIKLNLRIPQNFFFCLLCMNAVSTYTKRMRFGYNSTIDNLNFVIEFVSSSWTFEKFTFNIVLQNIVFEEFHNSNT